jgi:hypothetical protein
MYISKHLYEIFLYHNCNMSTCIDLYTCAECKKLVIYTNICVFYHLHRISVVLFPPEHILIVVKHQILIHDWHVCLVIICFHLFLPTEQFSVMVESGHQEYEEVPSSNHDCYSLSWQRFLLDMLSPPRRIME